MNRLISIAIIVFFIVANSAIRIPAIMNDFYARGMVYTMLLLSVAPMLISKGINRGIAAAAFVVLLNNALQFEFFSPIVWEVSDTLMVPVAITAAYMPARKQGYLHLSDISLPLLLIIPVKLLTMNDNMMGGRYIYSIGDALVILLYAIHMGRLLLKTHWDVSFLFFALAMGNALDNIIFDPYGFGDNEIWLLIIVLLVIIGRRLYKAQAGSTDASSAG